MNLLIFIIVVLVVLALALWAIRMLPMIDGTIKQLIMVLAVVIAIVVIVQKAGIL
jgi:hypothetical protein